MTAASKSLTGFLPLLTEIRPRFSPLFAWLLFIHGGACAALLLSELPSWGKLVLAMILVAHFGYTGVITQRLVPVRLLLNREERWWSIDHHEHGETLKLRNHFLLPRSLLLRFSDTKQKELLLLLTPKNAPPEALHKLRVYFVTRTRSINS